MVKGDAHTDMKLENDSPLISPGQPVLVVRRALICQKAFLHGSHIYFLGAQMVASFRDFWCIRRAAHSVVGRHDTNIAEDLLCHVAPAEILVHHLPADTGRSFAHALTYECSKSTCTPSKLGCTANEGVNNKVNNIMAMKH